jgi:hypothetical protein
MPAVTPRGTLIEETQIDEAFRALADEFNPKNISFSEKELEILELYDNLKELKLENALMEAQVSQPEGNLYSWVRNFLIAKIVASESDDPIAIQIKNTENEYLDSRAAYSLTESVTTNVMIADPVLKAIHSGENATPLEKYSYSYFHGPAKIQ